MSTVARKSRPQIGSYFVLRTLEQGAQTATHLATDTQTGRRVLLKTAVLAGGGNRRDEALAAALNEARRASGLAHPRIVPLHDSGEQGGLPYYAYELLKAPALSAWIAEHGRFEVGHAVDAALSLCQALSMAHEAGVVHRRLDSDSVLVAEDGALRLMGLGMAGADDAGDAGAWSARNAWELAAILYEMLTGRRPARGGTAVAAPSRLNPDVDERLDGLLMKALARAPSERYADLGELAAALASYLAPAESEPEEAAVPAQGTLEYLLRRIRHKGDFPALSATISAVNRAVASEREPIGVLCNSILKDFALTSRLLKIVNGSHLMQFGGAISTVSRAVSILGFDTVRNVSMSLMLFEHMHDRANAAALKDEIVGTYFSGLLARELCDRAGVRDTEQAFVCAMFHRLGKLLATFYLHDEALAVARHMQTQGWSEERASREVLGISYEELGVGVGKAWNFPGEIIDSMRAVAGPMKASPPEQSEKLRLLAGLANELSVVVRSGDTSKRAEQIAELASRYGAATGVNDQALVAAVQTSAKALVRDAESLGHGVSKSSVLRSANAWRPAAEAGAPARPETAPEAGPAAAAPGAPAGAPAAAPAPGSPAAGDEYLVSGMEPVAADTERLVSGARLESRDAPGPAGTGPAVPGQRQAALSAGIQDITNTLVGEHSLNDVLRIILETMYRAIGFGRVLLFVLDPRLQSLRCRFGFGADADAIIQERIALPLQGSRDLFYAAVVMGADLCIEDLENEKIRQHVPAWYRKAIGARGIVLLPIVNRKRTMGLIYADSDDPQILRFSAEELGLLKTLRNQALLAMRSAS